MLPLWFPDLHRVDHIGRAGAITVERLCEIAETPCVASGVGITRPVVLRAAAGKAAWICAERDDGVAVEIGTPHFGSVVDEARWALGCMAYSELADPVASASCDSQAWASQSLLRTKPTLSAHIRSFLEELAQAYRRHGFALGTTNPYAELTVEPLTEGGLERLRQALPRRTAR